MEYFEEFDTALNQACCLLFTYPNEDRRKTILLREILTNNKGYFNTNLFDFIKWLVSSTERERYISNNFNLHFIRSSPSQGKTDPYSLIKVSIHAESKFSFAQEDNRDWVKQSLSYWKKYCTDSGGSQNITKQITSNWKRSSEIDNSPVPLYRKRSVSPQKLPKPLLHSPKTLISPTRFSPNNSPRNSGLKSLALNSSRSIVSERKWESWRSASPSSWRKPWEIDNISSSPLRKRSISPQKSPKSQSSPRIAISPARHNSPTKLPWNSGPKSLALKTSRSIDTEQKSERWRSASPSRKKSWEVENFLPSPLRKRSLSPQKSPNPQIPPKKTSIHPVQHLSATSLNFKTVCSDLEETQKLSSVSPMIESASIQSGKEKDCGAISDLLCSITSIDKFDNDGSTRDGKFIEPALLITNNQQFLEQSFTLQKMIMDDKAISRTTSTETTFRVSKEPVLINNTGSLHKSMDSFDGVGSNSSLSTFMVKLEDDIKSNGATVADTRLPTAEKTAAILSPESNITHADKGTYTNSEVDNLNEGSSEKQEDLSRSVQSASGIANSTADRSSQSEVVYSTSESLWTNSILKANSNDISKKSKKSVDFTGINFESGEELPIGEVNDSDGKLYRLRYAQKLHSAKASKPHSRDRELSLVPINSEVEESNSKSSISADILKKKQQTLSTVKKHSSKIQSRASKSKDIEDTNAGISSSFKINPSIMSKFIDVEDNCISSPAAVTIFGDLSGEPVTDIMEIDTELPIPKRQRESYSKDGNLCSQSIDFSDDSIFNGTRAIEQPNSAISCYQDCNENSLVVVENSCEEQRDLGLYFGVSSPSESCFGAYDFVQLKNSLDKVSGQYDALRDEFEAEKQKWNEWMKNSKEFHKSLILYPGKAVFPSVVKKWQVAVKSTPKSSDSLLLLDTATNDSVKVEEPLTVLEDCNLLCPISNEQQLIESVPEEVPLVVESIGGELIPLESVTSPAFIESRDSDSDLNMEQFHVQRAKVELYEELSLQAIFQSPIDLSPEPEIDSLSLNIYYPNMERVIGGGVISALVAQQQPSVSYKSHQGENYYTMILSDPDALWLLMDEHVHWVVVNIPGDQVSEGTVVLPYLGPAPAKGSGMHRFVFSLYRQTTLFNAQQVDDCVKHFRVRQGIRTHNFMTSLQGDEGINMVDSTPVGIEAFLCEWEKGVDMLSRAKQPTENDEFSLDSSSLTNPSVYMSTPIGEVSTSKSASRAKSFRLRRNITFYKDIILSMVEKTSSEPSNERKDQDPQRSKSMELFHSNTFEEKENTKNGGNSLTASATGIATIQMGSTNRRQSSQNGAESSFLMQMFTSPSSLVRSSFSFDYSGKANTHQTASPSRVRSQSPIVANGGGAQKKFSPFLILSLATSPEELCNMLGVESTGMFDGGDALYFLGILMFSSYHRLLQ